MRFRHRDRETIQPPSGPPIKILLHVPVTAVVLILKPVVAKGANLRDGRKIPITMDQKGIVLVGEFRYAAVDGAANGMSAPPQV